MKRYDLDWVEQNLVVDFFLYKLTPEHRREFMHKYPALYNKLVGKEIMEVVNSTLGDSNE